MNREQIMNMEPGRELDALVAENVLGWTASFGPWGITDYWTNDKMESTHKVGEFKPSTDIATAWEVVEKIQKTHHFMLSRDVRYKQYMALFEIHGDEPPYEPFEYESDSMPEAICKAALLAVLDKEDPA